MPFWIWKLVACPGASVIAGFIAFAILLKRGRQFGGDGSLLSQRMVGSFMIGANFYTITIMLLGYFVFDISIGQSVSAYFGEGRISWLLLAIAADNVVRLYEFFYSKT
ncbi:hypothetical protein [Methylocystis sp.]|uniref:hypothetical protein n=1 Tax=Methylocystis sp. TaxID=1911079 RepID=UPI003DA511C8